MILYFSGTGNSRYIARRLASALHDELLDLNARIKAGDTSDVTVNGRLIVVTPTYAWRIPRVVRDWLQKTRLLGAAETWFVMSCGGEIGNAGRCNRALCREKGLRYQGTAEIVMPENYIAMFHAPQAAASRAIVSRAEAQIDRAADEIKNGRAFAALHVGLQARFKSGPVNPIFYTFFVKDKAFVAGEACSGCGVCVKRCPVNNITLQNGRPVWGGDCTHCMACICYCPAEAIEYGQKSVGEPRYRFEALGIERED